MNFAHRVGGLWFGNRPRFASDELVLEDEFVVVTDPGPVLSETFPGPQEKPYRHPYVLLGGAAKIATATAKAVAPNAAMFQIRTAMTPSDREY